jgi:hypothetical protein
MAVLKIPYQDINETLKGLHIQVVDSLDWCAYNLPDYKNPRQMYYDLLPRIKYKNDPPGVELIQSVPTLFENNYWGVSGMGDCDCFSVLTLAVGCVHKWKQRVVLCGRSHDAPVHIFSQVYWEGKWRTLDLTARLYDTHRHYPLKQFLEV